MSDVPSPPGGGYQPPPGQPPAGGNQPPPAPGYQPPAAPGYQPPAAPGYQQPPAAPPGGYSPPPAAPGMAPGVQPPPSAGAAPSSNGCLKAFLIVLVISIVLGGAGIVACSVFAGRVVDDLNRSFGVADPSDYEVKIDTCSVDSFGSLKASGTLTNKRNTNQAYQVKVSFSDENNVKLGEGFSGFTGTLGAGQTGSWDTVDYQSSAAGKTVTCKVSEVDYTLFNSK